MVTISILVILSSIAATGYSTTVNNNRLYASQNEFVAYLKLAALPNGVLSPRSRLIMLYALCGFANLGSVGIMIAGISGMVPERRHG